MTLLDPPAVTTSGLAEAVCKKLQTASAPLKLAEVAKGLPKDKKVKAVDFQDEVQTILDEEVRLGRVFSFPSAKAGASRYWFRDEKQILKEKAVELAATPLPLSALKTQLGKSVKGTDGAFVETLVRELIGDDRLFEYPPKTKKGGPLFGASPPPPPLPALEQPKHKKKAVDKLINDCRKVLAAAAVSAEDLFRILHARVSNTAAVAPGQPPPVLQPKESDAARTLSPEPAPQGSEELDGLILKAVSATPVVSLAELRREMPQEYQGPAFDEAILRLADEQQIVISQDADPLSFTPAERAEFVQDGGAVFTTVAKWS